MTAPSSCPSSRTSSRSRSIGSRPLSTTPASVPAALQPERKLDRLGRRLARGRVALAEVEPRALRANLRLDLALQPPRRVLARVEPRVLGDQLGVLARDEVQVVLAHA